MTEIRRCWGIFLVFLGELVVLVALAAACVAVGLGLAIAGKAWGATAVSYLGEVILIGGAGYTAWRAIVAEFVAIAKCQSPGK